MCSRARALLKQPSPFQAGPSPLATGFANEERVRGGSGRKDFLDLNSGFRIRTDNSGKAPAEQITSFKEGGVV